MMIFFDHFDHFSRFCHPNPLPPHEASHCDIGAEEKVIDLRRILASLTLLFRS